MKQEGQVGCPVDILKGDHQLREKNQSKVTPGVEEICYKGPPFYDIQLSLHSRAICFFIFLK